MYIANHYTRINGKKYTPGEVIQGDIPEGKKEWLLEAGAIRETAPASPPPQEQKTQDDQNGETEEERARRMTRENWERQHELLGYGPDGNPINKETDAEAGKAREADGEAAEEIDEEAEAPEIDVMDGVVSGGRAGKSADAAERRTTKKPAGRRKAK